MRPLEVRRTSETRSSTLRYTKIVFGGTRDARTSSRPPRRAPRQRGKCQVERVSRQAPKKYLSAGARHLPVCVRSQRTANASYLHQSESDATRAREYGYSTPRARRSELRVRPRPFKIVAAGFCFSLFSRFSWFDAQFDWSGSTSKCDRSASQPFRGTPTQESTVCGAKRRLIFFTCEKNLRFRQLELGAGAGGSAGWSSAVEPTSCKPAGAQFQGSNNNASGTVGRDGCGNRLG